MLTGIRALSVSNYRPEELAFYSGLLKGLPLLNEGRISGRIAGEFLSGSGLDRKVLHEIWSICDPENEGSISFEGFYKACRLIAHCQQGAFTVTPDLVRIDPHVLPQFSVINSSDQQVRTTNELIGRYSDTFDSLSEAGVVSPSTAHKLMKKSGLAEAELAEIWELSDADSDGYLNRGEFLVMMALVGHCRKFRTIPTSVPESIVHLLTHDGSAANLVKESVVRPSHIIPDFLPLERELYRVDVEVARSQDAILVLRQRIDDLNQELQEIELPVGSSVPELNLVTTSIEYTRSLVSALLSSKSELKDKNRDFAEVLRQKMNERDSLQKSISNVTNKLSTIRIPREFSAKLKSSSSDQHTPVSLSSHEWLPFRTPQ